MLSGTSPFGTWAFAKHPYGDLTLPYPGALRGVILRLRLRLRSGGQRDRAQDDGGVARRRTVSGGFTFHLFPLKWRPSAKQRVKVSHQAHKKEQFDAIYH